MKNKDKVKIYKGDFGYIKAQKKVEIIRTSVLLALPIALYIMGFLTTGSNKNLLTFVAVLGSLPFARAFINLLLFFRAGVCCSEDTYKKIVGNGVECTYYDLYYTSYKENFKVAALLIKKGCLIVYTESTDVNVEHFENHLKEIMKNCGGENYTVKVFTDVDKFIDRAKELNALTDNSEVNTFIYENLLSVSI